jgi:hypothetical protein
MSRRLTEPCSQAGESVHRLFANWGTKDDGGPGRTRTYNQQIMSQASEPENKENPALPSADSGKVLQNPQPPRNKKGGE